MAVKVENETWSIFNIGFVDHLATIDHFIFKIRKSIGAILFVMDASVMDAMEGFDKILCQGYEQFLIFQS